MWSFGNLSLLYGAGLVTLPIVLHLVMRRKPRLLEFPPLRFIQRRHEANRRQLQLRHLLLLAMRMALIALVAFALARPKVKLSASVLGNQSDPVAAVLVFDTSKRMEYRHENRTRLEAAQELALWLLAQFPAESQVAVLDSGSGPGAFQVDLGSARHRIQRLETMAGPQPVPRVIGEAARLLGESKLARKEVYVFTDLARVAWRADPGGRLEDRFRSVPGTGVYVLDVGVERPANFALGDLRLSEQVLSSRSSLRVETELAVEGEGGKRTVELFLLEPDPAAKDPGRRKPQKGGEQTVTLEANRAQPIEFPVGVLATGTHQGYLQVLGEDGLAADDRRYFTVEVKPAWRVLIAAPQPADEYALFLAQALAPESHRRSGRARFDCAVISLDDLRGRVLSGFSAVCLVDPKPLEPATWTKLGDYVSAGGGLAVFLGRNADPVDSFNQSQAQELLPGRLLRQARSPDGSLVLAPRNYEHPVLAPLRGRAGAIPWVRHPVYRYWQLGDPPQGVHVVARYSNDDPAILERPLGKGRVLTMTTPVSDDPNRNPWNLLPVGGSWPFVGLVHFGMLSYLVGAGDQRLNYFAGQSAVLPLDPQHAFRSYVLTTPDGAETRLAHDLKQPALVIASSDSASQLGNYRVRAGGAAEGVDRGFSVNLPAEQTRLERLPEKELAEVFGAVPYRIARNRGQIELDLSTGRVGPAELFPWLIVAAALVLGVEHVLANRFYRE